ncbi:hypothetical protein LJR230_002135 [Trinickia sp. LjRoot230]|uniref:hypothetical protein n=1 Tax=Trinickia sp. LjRoot230 TaxID=3342288 RepID=UPI003ECF8A23
MPNHLKLDLEIIARLEGLPSEHPSDADVETAIASAMTAHRSHESQIAFVRSWISRSNAENVVGALLDISEPHRWAEAVGSSFKESIAINTTVG